MAIVTVNNAAGIDYLSYFEALGGIDPLQLLLTEVTIKDGLDSFTINLSGGKSVTVSGNFTEGSILTTKGVIKTIEFFTGTKSDAIAVYPDPGPSAFTISMDALRDAVQDDGVLDLLGQDTYTFTGNNGADVFVGGDFGDLIDGGKGFDTMTGGKGNDTYRVSEKDDVINEKPGQGIDTVESVITYTLGAELENLKLIGEGRINATGNDLNNTLIGNGKANQLNGGKGADRMEGGAGEDTYIVDHKGDVVVETGGIEVDTVRSYISYKLTNLVERLELLGKANINGAGNGLNNSLYGNGGLNTLDGGVGADTMDGGAGDDIYIVDNVGDRVIESRANGGNDTVRSSVSYEIKGILQVGAVKNVNYIENLTLLGNSPINGKGNQLDNTIIGNKAANTLLGDAGNDKIDGGQGADKMQGGVGNDTYYVDNINDLVIETNKASPNDKAIDTVNSSITYTLPNLVENLNLIGKADINAIGNGDANVIVGNAGKNWLRGAGGQDTIDPGNDKVADTIAYTGASESTGVTRDLVRGMNFDYDKIGLFVTQIPDELHFVNVGTLSKATFDKDIAAVVDPIFTTGDVHAVMFDPNAGNLNQSNHKYLIIDANHDGVYVKGQDYVIEFYKSAGTLDLSDFI